MMQLTTKEKFLEKARDFTNFKLRTFKRQDRPRSLGFMLPMIGKEMLRIEEKYFPVINFYLIAVREDVMKDRNLAFKVMIHEFLEMTLTGVLMDLLIEEGHVIELYKVFDKALCIENPYLNQEKDLKISHFLLSLEDEEV